MSTAFRLGVFIVITLLILAGGIFWIGSKQFLFTRTYRLKADFQNVAGISNGAEVRVGGLHQGTVKHIELPRRPDEKVRIEMDLKEPTRDVVKKDSLAAIRSEGLVGDKYVEITFGSPHAAHVNDGDTIQSEPPVQMSDLVKKTDALLQSANGALQTVNATAENMKSITAKVNQGTGTVGALINDRSVYQHVNQAAAAFQEDMEAMKHNFLLRGFFKKRGYEDSSDLTKHAIARLPDRPAFKKFTYDASKLFDKPDTAKLKKEKSLDGAGAFLEQNPQGLVVVAAYSDLKGDTEKTKLLTEARAMVVREYLAEHFEVDDTRIKTFGGGKSTEGGDGRTVEILAYPASANLVAQNRTARKR